MAKVLISMPDDLLQELDEWVKSHGQTRSGLLAECVREYLVRRRALGTRLIDRPEVQAALADMRRLAELDQDREWDSTVALRELRDSA